MENIVAARKPRETPRDRIEAGALLVFVCLAFAAAIWTSAQQSSGVPSSLDASIDVYASAMPNNGWAPLTV